MAVSAQQQLAAVIEGLEAQRALLGDAVVDMALAPLRARLAALSAAPTAEPVAELVAGLAVPPAAPEQTLKQVTVLFLDVVGSTALTQHLDPEDIHAVMDRALASCTAIVEAHRGKVLQYAGDSLLAVFGADGAQEDDAERAVHCGLALLAEGRLQGEWVAQRHGQAGFDVRVGAHSGSVLLGGGVDAAGSIRGITVSIAARMEQSAPVGGLRISRDSFAQVRGVFDVTEDWVTVKGIDEPLRSYLVHGAKPRAFRVAARGIEGVETRMVGRDAELQLLQAAFERLHVQRSLQVVTVAGDAGVGKSRLLSEFQGWAEARPEVFYLFQGRAHPQTRSQPYGLLRDIIARRFQIADGDTMAQARDKMVQGVLPWFANDGGDAGAVDAEVAEAHAHLLGHLIGLDFADSPHLRGILDDARQIRSRGFHAAAQLLRRVGSSDGAPIVLMAEDLHWADDGSLDFLEHLAEVSHEVPMLLLGLTRPALFERRAGWIGADAGHVRIDLRPLDPHQSRLLTDEMLKRLPQVPAGLRELVMRGAEGNPFYMEELVKMLVDEGAIDTAGEHWSVRPDKLLAAHVPQTLTGVLQARLDSLQLGEKLALQDASVIGFVFWDQALAALDVHAIEALPALLRRELAVAHREASFEGTREYAFKHQLLHQVTYDTVLKPLRRALHAHVATWLAGLGGARANDFLGATAEHFQRADDHLQACDYFARAAEQAAGRFAHEAALAYIAQALALLGDADAAPTRELRWRLLDVRERVLDLRGQRAEQQADISALQVLADAMDDDLRRGEVAWRRSHVALRTADYRAMEIAARQALALAVRAGAAELGLRAQQRLSVALSLLGDPAAGRVLALEGLAASRAQGFQRVEGLFLNALWMMAMLQDDLVGSLGMSQQLLRFQRALGNRQSEATALGNLGIAWLALGDHGEAHGPLHAALQRYRAMGNRASEAAPLSTLAKLALWQGDPAMALTHANAALAITTAVQDRFLSATALCTIGEAELGLGHNGAAADAFERAQALGEAIGHGIRFEAAAGLARVDLARGDVGGALARVNRLLTDMASGASLAGTDTLEVRLTCHQVLVRAADARAADVLAIAHAELQARAATITDPALQHSFMNGVPVHRQIIAAWARARVAT